MMSFKDSDSKISFLIRLLNDSDKFVRDRITEEFLKIGEDSVPFLEFAARDEDPLNRAHAREILGLLSRRRLGEKFRKLSATSLENQKIDLEAGVLLIAEYGYPDLDAIGLRTSLDLMASELGSRFLSADTPLNIVEKLTAYLFCEKGFSGNRESFFDADNSYFNKVVQTGKGIPITLTVLCLLVGRRLNLPIAGVGMPAHFIASYDSPEGPIYFDPFDKGRILSKKDCGEIVKRFGFDFDDHFLARTADRMILLRMLHNLIMVYNQTNQSDRSKDLVEFSNILMNHPESLDHIKLI